MLRSSSSVGKDSRMLAWNDRIPYERNGVQGVHEVSLQFQEFITKASEKTDEWKLLQNETCAFKCFPFALFDAPCVWALIIY